MLSDRNREISNSILCSMVEDTQQDGEPCHAVDHNRVHTRGDFSPDDLYLLSQIFVGCKIS